jgi:hypothetical protein
MDPLLYYPVDDCAHGTLVDNLCVLEFYINTQKLTFTKSKIYQFLYCRILFIFDNNEWQLEANRKVLSSFYIFQKPFISEGRTSRETEICDKKKSGQLITLILEREKYI